MSKTTATILMGMLVLGISMVGWAVDMGTAFTYQGRLSDGGAPAEGLYDFYLRLYDDPVGGTQIGNTIQQNNIQVTDGLVILNLDMVGGDPDLFDGRALWLQIHVRPSGGTFTMLSPRQELTPTPYAIYATNAGSDSDWEISGNDMSSIPSGNVGIGMAVPSEKLDVNGNININSDYKIGGETVLSNSGTNNILVGVGAGENNIGIHATMVGCNAGNNNEGNYNTFLGSWAGYTNTTGYHNTFLGWRAGSANTTGITNVSVGSYSARMNIEGDGNTSIGYYAGYSNTTGDGNVFLGHFAGSNETGSNKLYIDNTNTSSPLIYGEFDNDILLVNGDLGVGMSPGEKLDVDGHINSSETYKLDGDPFLSNAGTNNVMVGANAGLWWSGSYSLMVGEYAGADASGSSNTMLGHYAGFMSTGSHTTMVGPSAGEQNAGTDNILVGEYAGGWNWGDGNICVGNYAGHDNGGNGNIFVGDSAGFYTGGDNNIFLGSFAGYDNVTGHSNTFIGHGSGSWNMTGANNTYLGHQAGLTNSAGSGNVFLGYQAGYNETGSNKLYIANSDTSTPLIYGDFSAGQVGIGTTSPGAKLHVLDDQYRRALNVVTSYTGTLSQLVNIERTQDPGSLNDLLQIEAPSTAPDDFQFIECERGTDVEFRVEGNGEVYADGSFHGGGADFAEIVAVSSGYSSVEAGDVMVIDPENPGAIIKSTHSRSTLVAGIYSTKPGFTASAHDWDQIALNKAATSGTIDTDEGSEAPAYSMQELAADLDEIPLAVVGIVPCKVSAENGQIRPGDLLVTSSTPGHAMRDDDPAVGSVLGKSLESLSAGTGVIKVLVTLQ